MNLNGTLEEFRFAYNSDEYDEDFLQESLWSRPYEYKYMINTLKKYVSEGGTVHDTGCGFAECNIKFRKKVSSLYDATFSDIETIEQRAINESRLSNVDFGKRYYYNLLSEDKDLEEKFDAVMNISVLEHLGDMNCVWSALSNLWKQVKPGGILVCSFDFPVVRLDILERALECKCECDMSKTILNGHNSIQQYDRFGYLNIVYLCIRKTQ